MWGDRGEQRGVGARLPAPFLEATGLEQWRERWIRVALNGDLIGRRGQDRPVGDWPSARGAEAG